MSTRSPNHVFKGKVGSLSPGTGAQFAILPPQNATGNFVKVVQRVPVRIYFDKNDKFVTRLKAGMSVYATIDTGHTRSLAACSACRRPRRKRTERDVADRAASPSAVPGLRRNMVTICAMTATIMQALDTTIANVALPYMQGTLSASQDQDQLGADLLYRGCRDHDRASGVDRQPLRAQAHLHRLLGRLHDRLCAVRPRTGHQPDGLFRLLAGRVRCGAGAAVAGRSCSNSYTLQERAKAMSIWGMGVMMGPIMGPRSAPG